MNDEEFFRDTDMTGCASSEPYALRVLGDSMEPEFKHGAIIIVDPGGVIRDGAYVIAQQGEEYIFRQLRIDGERYWLQALSEGHDIIELANASAIVGVVVQQGARRRKDRRFYV